MEDYMSPTDREDLARDSDEVEEDVVCAWCRSSTPEPCVEGDPAYWIEREGKCYCQPYCAEMARQAELARRAEMARQPATGAAWNAVREAVSDYHRGAISAHDALWRVAQAADGKARMSGPRTRLLEKRAGLVQQLLDLDELLSLLPPEQPPNPRETRGQRVREAEELYAGELYRRRGSTEIFRLVGQKSTGSCNWAWLVLTGVTVKYRDQVRLEQLERDFEKVQVPTAGQTWENRRTGAQVRVKRANDAGVQVVGPKRGKSTRRVIDWPEWAAHYRLLA